jgi:hypothetical protein
MGHHLTLYLRSLLPPHLRKHERLPIRHMHSLNFSQYKAGGLASLYLLGDDCHRVLFIATEVLGVGIDFPDIESVVDYPCPTSLISLVQHRDAGRPARGRGLH